MGIRDGELSVQRKNTKWFNEADGFPCTLQRRPKVPNGSGGFVLGAAVPRPEQVLRLVPLADATGGAERQTSDGVAVLPRYVLIGEAGADIQRFDRFTKDGRPYEVVYIVENVQYQVKAEVHYVG